MRQAFVADCCGKWILLACFLSALGCRVEQETFTAAIANQIVADPVEAVPSDTGWPCLFGPARNSSSPETNIVSAWSDAGPPELWRKAVGTGYSAPVATDGKLILFHRQEDEEVVACLDAQTGKRLWEHRYPTDYKCVYEYSSGPYCTPVIEAPYVWTVGAEGQLHCLDLSSGDVLWQRNLREEYQIEESLFGFGASPLLEEDRLVLNVGGSLPETGIVAIDKLSGKTLWTATEHPGGYSTPVGATIHEQRFVFVLTFEGLVALDPRDGQVFWQFPFQRKVPDSVNATTPLVVGNRVIVVTGPGIGSRCLEILPDKSYQEVWRGRRNLDSQFNNLVHYRDCIYGYTSKWNRGSTFNCVELETGKVRWRHASDLMRGSSIRCGKHMILWGELGHLASLEIDSQEPKVLCMTPEPMLKGPCFSAPALAGGLLYLRNEQELLCLDLRSK